MTLCMYHERWYGHGSDEMFILHDSSLACVSKQILLTGLLDSESPSVVSELTELTQKQLQASPPPPAAPPSSSSRGGEKRRVGGDEMTVSEILSLAAAMFSLAGERCSHSDREMDTLKVTLLSTHCYISLSQS